MISHQIKGGKKSFRNLKKKLGSDEAVTEHFRLLALKRKYPKKRKK